MQPRSDVRRRQRYTNNRSSCEQSSFMQSARHSLAGHGPSCSSRELRRQLVLDLLVSSGVGQLQQVAIVCRCGDSPACRPTSSTVVLIPLVMAPQPMDDTTMYIQSSGSSRLSCTSLQHTDRTPPHVPVPGAITAPVPVDWTWDNTTYRQPSNASHRANGFFYSCFPIWLSEIPRNYCCLRTEAYVRQAPF
ncbi:hypothetical protein AVEN_72838-1 [Araneus ventricosus]|uniref:Uncharacterized protein n=1 Tax=Araneus ventricosus TaxID=182803 RepID=A0A4Y2F8W7_ARAVE|nr:hypothetical protein AVEN_72838-1 [Araneus ventricosus]